MVKLVEALWKVGVLLIAMVLAAACGQATEVTPSPAPVLSTATEVLTSLSPEPATSPGLATATSEASTPATTPSRSGDTPTSTGSATTSPSPTPATPDATGTPTASTTISAVVATEDEVLRVRGGPGTEYAVLGRLEPGTELTLLARSADGPWYQFTYPLDSDGRGWVIGEFLEIQGSPDQLPMVQTQPASALVATENEVLNVRGGPGTDYAVLGKLEPGTELTLLAQSADSLWYQFAFPAGSDERGWVIGEFLEIQGAPDQLPIAQAPAAPTVVPAVSSTQTVTPTIQTAEACAPISGQDYGTLPIASAPTDRPAESHADLNLNLRGYASTDLPNALIDLSGARDPGAPQLRGLFSDGREPAVTGVYQAFDWDWNANAPGGLIGDPVVTLLGVQTATGEIIDTPDAGGDLGEGYVAVVLYASPNRITLKYTRDDNVIEGYTLHIENVCVEPQLLTLYQQMNDAGRSTLPALRPGQSFGRATGSEIGIVVRDKGSFMDPRSRKDWW